MQAVGPNPISISSQNLHFGDSGVLLHPHLALLRPVRCCSVVVHLAQDVDRLLRFLVCVLDCRRQRIPPVGSCPSLSRRDAMPLFRGVLRLSPGLSHEVQSRRSTVPWQEVGPKSDHGSTHRFDLPGCKASHVDDKNELRLIVRNLQLATAGVLSTPQHERMARR